MKAEELMIGDWVKIKTYGVSDKYERTEAYIYVKVVEIGSGLITVQYNNDIKEPYRICENIEIEPIPLTSEILEKNGFHKEWDEDIILMVCDTIIVEIGDKYKLYKDGKIYLRRVLSPLYYVHQLQHALRLCGIDKEIVI